MPRRTALWILAIAFAGLAAWVAGAHARDDGRALPVYIDMHGTSSAISEPWLHVAASQPVWDSVWSRHKGDVIDRAAQGWAITPTIDFDACMAICIFAGLRTNMNAYRIDSVVEFDDHIRVRYVGDTFQTAFPLGDAPDVVESTPYCIALVPRIEKAIVLEEGVPPAMHAPPEWHERARLEPGRIKGFGDPPRGAAQRQDDD